MAKKILIAPDSFKGSLSAQKFCQIASEAIHSIDASVIVDTLPLADGGEGSVDALLSLEGSQKVFCKTVDALNREINDAYYAYFPKRQLAFIEMASAAGLVQLKNKERNPFVTSTYGVGIMIKHAIQQGAKEIILGLGGSATNDGGIGCLAALGMKFLDKNKKSIALNNQGLGELVSIDASQLVATFNTNHASSITIKVACDITNPLCGQQGASVIFAKQKGAKDDELSKLDANLAHFAHIVGQNENDNQALPIMDIANISGAGAAGGMGAGLLLLGAKLAPGFDLISNFLQLPEQLKQQQYDLVITGEGEFNHQSEFGKVPVALAKLCQKAAADGKKLPVIAICGGVSVDAEDCQVLGLKAVFSLCSAPMSLDFSMQHAETLLYQSVQHIYQLTTL